MRRPLLALLSCLLGLLLVLGACGSSETSTATSAGAAQGAAGFIRKGADNSIQEAGDEAPASVRRRAAASLHAFLDARAAEEWGEACRRLARPIVHQLVSELGKAGASCVSVLRGLSTGLAPSALREAALARVGAFRVEGREGFLLFHGAGGQSYFIPMVREGGAWKVAAIAASPLS